MHKQCWGQRLSVVCALLPVTAIAAQTQTFTVLASFNDSGGGGAYPVTALAQGLDGDLYGTTGYGGSPGHCPYPDGCGTVFKITPPGTLTTVYSFCAQPNCTDGEYPNKLVLATDGNFYGTTYQGGANSWGVVFRITPAGTLTTLHAFDVTDGSSPLAGLVQAANGAFYGTTFLGGVNSNGTVFEITASGALTTLHKFQGTDGANPYTRLVQATDGNLYGTTAYGGSNNAGTLFRITPAGVFTKLHDFDSTDGYDPLGALIQAVDGNLYGTTSAGGTHNQGTAFRITLAGALTTLHSFHSTDGADPVGGLIQGTDGNLYGLTNGGGTDQAGTIFEITPGGALTTLHSFDNIDGNSPHDGLLQRTNGTFYGTAYLGGSDNDGTVYSLATGLGPFVETLPTSSKIGSSVKILGTNLTGAISVTFGGVPANFTVVSASEIATAVPDGAATGTVQVTTPGGILSSSVAFQVIP